MEKMITIFTEVAVAAIILFGLVAMASGLMDAGELNDAGKLVGQGAIYSGIHDLIQEIFNSAKNAAMSGI